MRKILAFAITLLFLSCGATKNVRNKEKVLKGNWNLTNIAYSKTGSYNVTLFNDASKECLEGSSWKFVPNNNSGVYVIEKPNCSNGERDFAFTIT